MSATVRYELSVWIEVPVEDGDDPRDYVTQPERSRLERSILRGWKLDGDIVNIEVMDTTIIDDEHDPRERGDDDGVEYGDPRDAREGGRR
jgi:hypothetical protein